MNQLLKLLILVIGLVVVTPADAAAENLSDAWREALAVDPIVQASESRVSAARLELGAARSGRLPGVAASAGITRFDEAPSFDFSGAGIPVLLPLFGGESMRMADARLTLPLYTGGRVTSGIDAAKASLTSQQHQARVNAQQVKLAVAESFIGVLRAQSALAVAESTVKSLTAHVNDVEDMYRSGAVARNDYLAAAVSLADAEQRQLQAENTLDIASAAYNRALGRPLDRSVALDEQLPGIDPTLELSSLTSLTEVAMQSRTELGGLDAAAAAFRNQADSVRARTRPQLALSAGYLRLQNDFLNRDEFWSVGVGVQWSLFDGGKARRQASALALQSDALEYERKNLRSVIELEVRETWLRLNETRKRQRLAKRAVDQADENLRVVRDRYRNGEGTNSDVLNAERLRSLSRSNHDNANFDASLALYRLARGVGRL